MGSLSDRFAEDGKTVLNGTVDPTTEGVDGDFYINTTSNEIFGPKTGGAWGTGTSLVGPAGGIVGTNVGEVFAWPVDSMTPANALKCDGSAVDRTTEAELFAVIGVTYGAGDGSTTFNLPDYRGQFLRGTDSGAGVDPDAGSRTDRGDGITGDAVGTKQEDEFESHTHDVTYLADAAEDGIGTIDIGGGQAGATLTDASTATGGNETRPKNINVDYYIRTKSVDPLSTVESVVQTGTVGNVDTYTLYGDVAETEVLGTFNITNSAGVDFITSEGSNANGYYRVWNSGLIEQWGIIGATGAHVRVIQTMPVAFTNVSSILPTLIRTDGAKVDDGGRNVDSITLSSIGFINSTAKTIGEMRWSAKGY